MARTAHLAAPNRQIIRDLLNSAEVLVRGAAVVHAIVRIDPVDAPPLNFTVNESPEFRVSADP